MKDDPIVQLAIVGTSTLTHQQARTAEAHVYNLLTRFDPDIVISGGADGVDRLATMVSRALGYRTVEFLPKTNNWAGYKTRNRDIALNCTHLVCITVPTWNWKCFHCNHDHERTGGCYTMKLARNMGKPTELIICL